MSIHQLDLLDHLHGKVGWKSVTMASGIQFVGTVFTIFINLVILKPEWFVSSWDIPLKVISCVN